MKSRQLLIEFRKRDSHIQIDAPDKDFTESETGYIEAIGEQFLGQKLTERLILRFAHAIKLKFDAIGEDISVEVIELEDVYEFKSTHRKILTIL